MYNLKKGEVKLNNLEILNEVRISSKDLCDLINRFRSEEGNTTKKEHNDLMKSIRKEIQDLKNAGINEGNFSPVTYTDAKGEKRPCFSLNRDGALQILNKESALVRYKTIQYINKLEEELKEQNKPSYMIDDRVKRAEKWIEEEKERQQLQLENKQQTKVIEKQSEVIGEMAPKADYFDALVDRKLLTSIRDTAKELGVKERTFTEWLIQRNLCYRDKKRKLKPYANKMQYFELKEFTTIWGHSDTQTLITPKGRETFRLLLIKDGLIKDKNKQMELETLLKDNEVVKSDFYS